MSIGNKEENPLIDKKLFDENLNKNENITKKDNSKFEKEVKKDKKLKFFNIKTTNNNMINSSSCKMLSRQNNLTSPYKNIIKDNLSPKSFYSNLDKNPLQNLHEKKNKNNSEFTETESNKKQSNCKNNSNDYSNRKYISNIYKRLNFLNIMNSPKNNQKLISDYKKDFDFKNILSNNIRNKNYTNKTTNTFIQTTSNRNYKNSLKNNPNYQSITDKIIQEYAYSNKIGNKNKIKNKNFSFDKNILKNYSPKNIRKNYFSVSNDKDSIKDMKRENNIYFHTSSSLSKNPFSIKNPLYNINKNSTKINKGEAYQYSIPRDTLRKNNRVNSINPLINNINRGNYKKSNRNNIKNGVVNYKSRNSYDLSENKSIFSTNGISVGKSICIQMNDVLSNKINQKINSNSKNKELNYVKFLENNSKDTIFENALMLKKHSSIAVSEIEKFKSTLTESNSNLKNNNKYSSIYNSSNKNINNFSGNKKITNFTFGKKYSNANKTTPKEVPSFLIEENAKLNYFNKIEEIQSKDLKSEKSPYITKDKIENKAFLNGSVSKKYKNLHIETNDNKKTNFKINDFSNKNSIKNINLFTSLNKLNNKNFLNYSVKSKNNKISFVDQNKVINPRYNFCSKNFNSNILNKVKNKPYSSPAPNNIKDNYEIDEKTKEETFKYLESLDFINSLRNDIERKFNLQNHKGENHELKVKSSNSLIPIELQNSVKNSDSSFNTGGNNVFPNLKVNNFDKPNAHKNEFYNFKKITKNLDDEDFVDLLKINQNISNLLLNKNEIFNSKSFNKFNGTEESGNISLKRNNFLEYKFNYLNNRNNHFINDNSHTRYFSEGKIESDNNSQFIRNKYKNLLSIYLSEPNSPIYSFCI